MKIPTVMELARIHREIRSESRPTCQECFKKIVRRSTVQLPEKKMIEKFSGIADVYNEHIVDVEGVEIGVKCNDVNGKCSSFDKK